MKSSGAPEDLVVHEITELPLRDVFKREDHVFTPWLARPQNLARLGRALEMELEVVATEVSTGSFRTDILARRTTDGAVVVIENQFNRSDHDHLGKTLTYLAAHAASVVVWIAESFADEHRAVFDWLNKQTPDEIGFYAVVPRLIRIGDSPPGLRFDVEIRPNTFLKQVNTSDRRLSDTTTTVRQAFWEEFARHKAASEILAPALERFGGGWGHLWLIQPESLDREDGLHVLVYLNVPSTGLHAVNCSIYAKNGFEELARETIDVARIAIHERAATLAGDGPMLVDGHARLEVDLSTEEARSAAIAAMMPYIESAYLSMCEAAERDG